jgi:hypothetical protein
LLAAVDCIHCVLTIYRNAVVMHTQEWLKHEGSPASQIEDCKFGAEQDLDSPTHKSFEIVR